VGTLDMSLGLDGRRPESMKGKCVYHGWLWSWWSSSQDQWWSKSIFKANEVLVC
jgi:hypothetical protein